METTLRRQLWPSPGVRQLLFLLFSASTFVIALAYLIPTVWMPTWQEGGLAYVLIKILIDQASFIEFSSAALFFIGSFYGLSFLWLLDSYKKYQGVILWFSILTGTAFLLLEWDIRFDFIISDPIFFGIGVILGLQIGGLPIIQRYIRNSKKALLNREPRNFKWAVRLTYVFIFLVAIIGITDAHIFAADSLNDLENYSISVLENSFSGSLENPDQIIIHLVALTIVFLPLTYSQRYKDPERIIQIGPAQSGKTSTQGGLYLGTDEPLPEESPLLTKIVDEYMKSGRFPNRTKLMEQLASESEFIEIQNEEGDNEDGIIIEFSFITIGDLMPKQKVITTVDYPGEVLTGGRNVDPLSESIKNMDRTRRWNSVISDLKTSTDGLSTSELSEHLAHLIQNADHVIFTLPLDDFLGPLVRERQSSIPKYHRNSIWEITQPEEENDAEYKMKRVSEENWIYLQKDADENTSNGQYSTFTASHGEIPDGFIANKEAWRGTDGEFYYRDGRERAHPTTYIREYESILNELDDLRNHNFIWLATMADLVYGDFDNSISKLKGVNFIQDGNSIKYKPSDEKMELGGEEIVFERMKDLFENWRGDITDSSTRYQVFSEWVLRECLSDAEVDFKRLLHKTREMQIYPVRFEIEGTENEEYFKIPEDGSPLFGSSEVMDKISGSRNKRTYPGGFMGYPISTSSKGYNKMIPESHMAYQIIKEVQRDDSETTSDEGR